MPKCEYYTEELIQWKIKIITQSPPLIPLVALTNDKFTDFCMHVQTKIYKLQRL